MLETVRIVGIRRVYVGFLYVVGITVLIGKKEVSLFSPSLYKGALCSGIVELYLPVSLGEKVIPWGDPTPLYTLGF